MEPTALLRDGRVLLETSAVSRNHLFFHYAAIDLALEHRRRDEAEQAADPLAAYTAAEPLPWSELLIERVRVLTAPDRRADGTPPSEAAAGTRKPKRAARPDGDVAEPSPLARLRDLHQRTLAAGPGRTCRFPATGSDLHRRLRRLNHGQARHRCGAGRAGVRLPLTAAIRRLAA